MKIEKAGIDFIRDFNKRTFEKSKSFIMISRHIICFYELGDKKCNLLGVDGDRWYLEIDEGEEGFLEEIYGIESDIVDYREIIQRALRIQTRIKLREI